jgi:hypothetical protein
MSKVRFSIAPLKFLDVVRGKLADELACGVQTYGDQFIRCNTLDGAKRAMKRLASDLCADIRELSTHVTDSIGEQWVKLVPMPEPEAEAVCKEFEELFAQEGEQDQGPGPEEGGDSDVLAALAPAQLTVDDELIDDVDWDNAQPCTDEADGWLVHLSRQEVLAQPEEEDDVPEVLLPQKEPDDESQWEVRSEDGPEEDDFDTRAADGHVGEAVVHFFECKRSLQRLYATINGEVPDA